jgi:hypothetical protein
MIAPSVVQEVRRLLAEDRLSQRKIAKTTGISRGTVAAIAAGRRPDYDGRRGNGEDHLPEPAGSPQRCPGCGGLVYMPCRTCRTRALRAAFSRPAPSPDHVAESVAPELTEEHRRRYQQVRAEALARDRALLRPLEENDPQADEADLWDEWDEPQPEDAELWNRFGPWDDWDGPAIDDVMTREYEEPFLPDST